MGYSMQEHVQQNQRAKVEDSVGFGGPKSQTPPLPKIKCKCVPPICSIFASWAFFWELG